MTEADDYLFDMADIPVGEPARVYRNLHRRVWTASKARLIERYLKYFVYVTRHGTYIDAFSGPQNGKDPDSWAARLVLRNRPAWLRHFRLIELSPQGADALRDMVAEEENGRDVSVIQGDANVELPQFLSENPIRNKEATFCLLDQRTFECDWNTVRAVASHKQGGNKIEVFYFFGQGWIDRSVAALRSDPEVDMHRWWGSDGWERFMTLKRSNRGDALARRFRDELGYKFAQAFPIFEAPESSRIMFFMVHASDHDLATDLMIRAYNNSQERPERDQTLLEFEAQYQAAVAAGEGGTATDNTEPLK